MPAATDIDPSHLAILLAAARRAHDAQARYQEVLIQTRADGTFRSPIGSARRRHAAKLAADTEACYQGLLDILGLDALPADLAAMVAH